MIARLAPRPVAVKPPRPPAPKVDPAWQHAYDQMQRGVTPDPYRDQWQAALAKTHPAPAAPAAPAPPDDPRDAQYNESAGLAQRNRDAGLADLTRQDTYAKTDLESAIRRLAQSRAQSQQGSNAGMNKQGLFYSSTAQNAANDITTNHANQKGDATDAYNRGVDARNSGRGQLGRDYEQGITDLYGQAVLRALQRKGAGG